jgi:hypothetical protein
MILQHYITRTARHNILAFSFTISSLNSKSHISPDPMATFAAMNIIMTGAAITSSVSTQLTARTQPNYLQARDERYFCSEKQGSYLQKAIEWVHNIKTRRKYSRISNRNYQESALHRLPNELLEQIALYLPPADVLTLVRTCKHTASLQRRRYFDQPALLIYWRRMRRNAFASRLALENKSWNLPGVLWCDHCSEFHLKTSFEKGLGDAPDDGRECLFPWEAWINWYYKQRIGVPERK